MQCMKSVIPQRPLSLFRKSLAFCFWGLWIKNVVMHLPIKFSLIWPLNGRVIVFYGVVWRRRSFFSGIVRPVLTGHRLCLNKTSNWHVILHLHIKFRKNQLIVYDRWPFRKFGVHSNFFRTFDLNYYFIQACIFHLCITLHSNQSVFFRVLVDSVNSL